MTRSKKRNISLAVLGLSIAVLGADRLFLGATDAVSEVAANTVVANPLPATGEAELDASNDKPFAHVAARLEEALDERGSNPEGLPDIFRRPMDWADSTHQVAVVNKRRPLSQEFLSSHDFTAVMVAGGESMAVIDGRARRVGATIDDFTLINVGPRHITLERFGQSARIELDRRNGR